MGGDEFTIILEGVTSEENISVVAKRITESIATPFEIKNRRVSVGISIGITVYPHDDKEVDDLLKHADDAMYQAKQQGGNGYRFYGSNEPQTPDLFSSLSQTPRQ
jgi:diguanylate cyclase (GGDEF)-like protein